MFTRAKGWTLCSKIKHEVNKQRVGDFLTVSIWRAIFLVAFAGFWPAWITGVLTALHNVKRSGDFATEPIAVKPRFRRTPR
jgi:hypothetical protein